MVFWGGLALGVLAALWAVFPRVLAVPVVIALGWLGLSLLWKAWRLRKPPAATLPAALPGVEVSAVAQPPAASPSGGLQTDATR